MIHETDISVRAAEAASDLLLNKHIRKKLGLEADEISGIEIVRKSIDARRHPVWIRMKVRVYTHGDKPQPWQSPFRFQKAHNSPAVVIAGAGPAGLFAALKLLEQGFKPVVLERGKEVSDRKRDIARINREHKVNPDSNYCFGEGGAGTFSDGKLYTRSTKRGDVQRILQMMVHHGANHNILYEAHPHIGTDKLLPMITAMRNTILDHGGEIHFGHRLEKIIHQASRVTAFQDQLGNRFEGFAFILATGHSAREIYQMFHREGWILEQKPFAIGVRVEHPQSLIDSIQYHVKNPDPLLPPATYSLATQVHGKGVFSFCMCPGGIIVPSATNQNQLVVNGMSNSRRNSPRANAGIVTEVTPEDLAPFMEHGPLAGMAFQEQIEQQMLVGGALSQRAPAQRLTHFLQKTCSNTLPETSYHPGIQSAPLHQLLPPAITDRLIEGFKHFNKKMRGFITDEAIVIGVESRTSSPVRIPRDPILLSYPQFSNLYPTGEGAGYAGGIASSAIDGERVADAIVKSR
jgi:uncharacterized FAD-dependent dehydrogenase